MPCRWLIRLILPAVLCGFTASTCLSTQKCQHMGPWDTVRYFDFGCLTWENDIMSDRFRKKTSKLLYQNDQSWAFWAAQIDLNLDPKFNKVHGELAKFQAQIIFFRRGDSGNVINIDLKDETIQCFFGGNLPERFAITAIWVFPNIWVFPPQIIHLFIGFGFPLFSPSILGVYPYFWKHPYYGYMIIYNSDHNSSLKIQTPMCCPCVSADKSMVLLLKRFTSPGQWTYHPCIQTCVCHMFFSWFNWRVNLKILSSLKLT